jgi:ADP-heptose:LPS heptosyltransferase
MSACRNPLQAPPEAERILVIRLGALGDVLRTLPAVAGLRALYPRARIDWLVEPAAAGAAALSPAIDGTIVFPRPEIERAARALRPVATAVLAVRFVRGLRARGFDLVVDFHGILKSGVLAWLSGAPVRVGYARPFAREGNVVFTTHRAAAGAAPISRYTRNAALVEYLGGRVGAGGRAVLALPGEACAVAHAQRAGAGEGAVLHPGTSAHTPHKRWRPERFAALARVLAADLGAPCRVIAGPDPAEARLAEAVVASAGGAARLDPPVADLGALAAGIARAPLFVGADSGPLHLASLVGTPVVQILGPTHPVENAPWPGTPSRVVREPVACSPCRRGCGAPVCMDAVSVRAVVEAARALRATARETGATPPGCAA